MISPLFLAQSIQLVPDGTLFLHVALIILMVFVLNATLFRPINRILEERDRLSRGGRNAARDILRQADEKLAAYEGALRAARAENYRLMEQERDAALRERQESLSRLRDELEQTLARETQSLAAQVDAARRAIATEAPRLAGEIGAQILGRPLRGIERRA